MPYGRTGRSSPWRRQNGNGNTPAPPARSALWFHPVPGCKTAGDTVVRDGYGDGIEGFHLCQPSVADDCLVFKIGYQVARIPLERKEVALL